MTGSESLNLTHPVLRRLWRARFAEAQLLTYDDRAREPRPNPRPQPEGAAAQAKDARLGHGPMIVCLDTSGSMQGAPEQVAKACVLQAMRSAHAGDRACQLLAFGGPGELIERPLTRDTAGLDALLDLMGQAFDGGYRRADPDRARHRTGAAAGLAGRRRADRQRRRVRPHARHAGRAAPGQATAGPAGARHLDRRPRDHRPGGNLRHPALGCATGGATGRPAVPWQRASRPSTAAVSLRCISPTPSGAERVYCAP